MDRGDIFEVHKRLGHKFCLSGGIPNFILAYRTGDDVREHCKKVIDGVAQDGGYVMDASAIMQTDTKAENLKALTDFTREYGVYSSGSSHQSQNRDPQPSSAKAAEDKSETPIPHSAFRTRHSQSSAVCIPWDEKIKELPAIPGDTELVRRVWENIDALGNMFVWQCLVSF